MAFPHLPLGTLITEAIWNGIMDFLNLFLTQGTYLCGWHGTSTDPAIGNGTKSARFLVLGVAIIYDIHIVMGSTTTYGSGYWTFDIPVPTTDLMGQVGMAHIIDISGPTTYTATALMQTLQSFSISSQAAGAWAQGAPFTFTTGDVIRVMGIAWRAT